MDPLESAVMDTGPLCSLLALTFVERTFPSEEAREHRFRSCNMEEFIPIERRSAARSLLTRIRRIHITSHVIGELQGHTHRLGLEWPLLGAFWSNATDVLRAKMLDERLISLLDLAGAADGESAYERIGPTDDGLIRLAAALGYPLITDDERTLAPRAWERKLDCRLFNPLLEEHA